MNWPEHLQVIHRLTGHRLFELSHYGGNKVSIEYVPNLGVWHLYFDSQTVYSCDDRAMAYHLSDRPNLTLGRSS